MASPISTGITHDAVVRGFDGEYTIVAPIETRREFRETLLTDPDRFNTDEAAVQKEAETIRYFAEFVEPAESVSAVGADRDDDEFLEAAIAGDVDYVVSGDRHLLDLGSFRGIEFRGSESVCRSAGSQ